MERRKDKATRRTGTKAAKVSSHGDMVGSSRWAARILYTTAAKARSLIEGGLDRRGMDGDGRGVSNVVAL